MGLIADYFGWIFDQGFMGAVVMLALTAVAVAFAGLIVAHVVLWGILVPVAWVFRLGKYRRETPRRVARRAKTDRLLELRAQGYNVHQIHDQLKADKVRTTG